MNDGQARYTASGDAGPEHAMSIDELLERAVAAINRGDRAIASAVAGQVTRTTRCGVPILNVIQECRIRGGIER